MAFAKVKEGSDMEISQEQQGNIMSLALDELIFSVEGLRLSMKNSNKNRRHYNKKM